MHPTLSLQPLWPERVTSLPRGLLSGGREALLTQQEERLCQPPSRAGELSSAQRYAEQELTSRGFPRLQLQLAVDQEGLPMGICPTGGYLYVHHLREQLDRLAAEAVHDASLSPYRRLLARRMRKEVSTLLHRVEAASNAASSSRSLEIKNPSALQGELRYAKRYALSGSRHFLQAGDHGGVGLERLWLAFMENVHQQLALDCEQIAAVCRRAVEAIPSPGVSRPVRTYTTANYIAQVSAFTTPREFFVGDMTSAWAHERLLNDVPAIAEGRKQVNAYSCVITRRDSGGMIGEYSIPAYVEVVGDRRRQYQVVTNAISNVRRNLAGQSDLRSCLARLRQTS